MQHTETKSNKLDNLLSFAGTVSNSCVCFTFTVSSGYGYDKIYCTFLLGAKTKFFIIIQVNYQVLRHKVGPPPQAD